MKNQKEVIELLDKKDAVIYIDFLKDITTFRVINGKIAKQFPIALFSYLKEKGIIIIKKVLSFHSRYEIISKAKQKELGIKI